MPDSATLEPVVYHDIYTAARGGSVFSTEQLVFLLAALFLLGIFLLICFAGTILITRWIVTDQTSVKSKCSGDEEEHYRMRQDMSEWKLAQERLRADVDRKLDRERDMGARRSPSTVIKIDQPAPQPPAIIERGRDCHSGAPDMSQIMNLLQQRPLIQTVFSQPPVTMGMPMPAGYNPYSQPQAIPPQGYPMPQHQPPPSHALPKRKKSSSISPDDVRPVSITRATSTLTTSASSRRSKKRRLQSRSRTPSQTPSRSPASVSVSRTEIETDTPRTFRTTSKTSDLPELTDGSGDHRSESSATSVSSHTSDLSEFSDVPAVKHRPKDKRRRRDRSRSTSRTSTPSSTTNNDLMEFSDSSRKGLPKKSESTSSVSSVPSTSSVSTSTLTPERQGTPSPRKSRVSSASSSPSSPMRFVKSNKGSADSTLSVEMSPQREKVEKKVDKVVDLQFKPANAAATMMTLAKYQKTRNRHQQNAQFQLVPDESDSPVSTTDLGTSISSSVSSSTVTPTPAPKEPSPKPIPPTTSTSPTTSTWTPRPPLTVSTPPTTTSPKPSETTSPVTTTARSNDSPVEKASPVTPKSSSPPNEESEKQLRRNVACRPSFAGALVDNLARHGKADHKKAATWRYQFVPDDTQRSPKSFRQAPTLPAPELKVDVTQEDESIRRDATLHRLPVHPRTIGGVIHTQAARGKFDSTAFAVNEQFVIVPDDEGFRSESQSTQSSATAPSTTTSTSQPTPPPQTAAPSSVRTPNIADKIYQSRNPYWRARIDETAPTHDIANVRHILSPKVETAISKQPSDTSPDASMLARSRSSRRRDSLTVSAESLAMPAPLNRGTFVRPGPTA